MGVEVVSTTGGADLRYAPQQASLVAPIDPVFVSGTAFSFTANDARGCRIVIPRSGVLHDLSVYVASTSGNVDIGIYDTASTRNRLYSSGAVAMSGLTGGAWNIIADPSYTVQQGDQYDLVLACDNATATFGRFGLLASNASSLPTGFYGPLRFWSKGTSYTLPSTIATPVATGSGLVIIGRIV